MRNPSWVRDEVLLALNLYFNIDYNEISAKNAKVIKLSEVLNQLPVHSYENRNQKFRNANGVALKLANFAAIDPDAKSGMSSYSKLDIEIFNEFKDDQERLKIIASKILNTLFNEGLRNELYNYPNEDNNFGDTVEEGRVLYKLHRIKERNNKIIDKKKKQAIKQRGKLDCEVCGFEFNSFYGNLGDGFIECHHNVPLSEQELSITTSLNDLSLVCSNCHRMLHRSSRVLSIKELKEKIKMQRTQPTRTAAS